MGWGGWKGVWKGESAWRNGGREGRVSEERLMSVHACYGNMEPTSQPASHQADGDTSNGAQAQETVISYTLRWSTSTPELQLAL